MNYEIEQFHKQLVQLINNCGIPVGAAVYVMKDCYNELLRAYNDVLQEEVQEIEAGTHTQEEEIELTSEELNALSNEEGELCNTNFVV